MLSGTSADGTFLQLKDGRFVDDRWVGGRWVLSKFNDAKGETDWDAVIDAGGERGLGRDGGEGERGCASHCPTTAGASPASLTSGVSVQWDPSCERS